MNEKKHTDLDIDSISENLESSIARPRPKSKSARTTFTVSQETDQRMQRLKTKYDMSPKHILDLVLNKGPWVDVFQFWAENQSLGEANNIKKSVVLSERILDQLSKLARKTKIPRNTLFTSAIHLMETSLLRYEEQRQEECRNALTIIQKATDAISEAEGELHILLEKDDPIISRWSKVSIVADNAYFAIQAEADGGEPVDPDDL